LKQDPALHQWASTFVGAAAVNTVGGDAQTGGSTAASGTKNNNEYIDNAKQSFLQQAANTAIGAAAAKKLDASEGTSFVVGLNYLDNATSWSSKLVNAFNSIPSPTPIEYDNSLYGDFSIKILRIGGVNNTL